LSTIFTYLPTFSPGPPFADKKSSNL